MWQEGPCRVCECLHSRVTCYRLVCPLHPLGTLALPVEGKCCPECQSSKSGCNELPRKQTGGKTVCPSLTNALILSVIYSCSRYFISSSFLLSQNLSVLLLFWQLFCDQIPSLCPMQPSMLQDPFFFPLKMAVYVALFRQLFPAISLVPQILVLFTKPTGFSFMLQNGKPRGAAVFLCRRLTCLTALLVIRVTCDELKGTESLLNSTALLRVPVSA